MAEAKSDSSGGFDVIAWLDGLAGGTKRVRPNARSVSAGITNTRCTAREALDAARIDKALVARDLGCPGDFGQSPFALARGNQFERRVKRDELSALLNLLREQGLDPRLTNVIDLKTEIPFHPNSPDEDLAKRAAATRTAILNIAHDDAGDGTVIDGGALTWTIGGATVRLETDALAWWVGGKLRVIEMKSYPVEWGQISADNVIALSWQTAVYVAAMQDLLVAAGEDPDLVSTVIFLICPKNTSLKPVIVPHDVAPQLRLLRRFQFQQRDLSELAGRVGPITVDLASRPADERAVEIGRVVELLEPSYQPNCLSTCELAPHCRGQAQDRGEAAAISAQMVQLVGGTGGMLRAAALLAGESPVNVEESEFVTVVAAEESVARLVQASSRPVSRP